MPCRFRKLLNCRMKLEVNYPMNVDLTDYFWLVHFRDRRDDSIDTEELDQPVSLIPINIEWAIKEATDICKNMGYEFISLDLVSKNLDQPCYTFPHDLKFFE